MKAAFAVIATFFLLAAAGVSSRTAAAPPCRIPAGALYVFTNGAFDSDRHILIYARTGGAPVCSVPVKSANIYQMTASADGFLFISYWPEKEYDLSTDFGSIDVYAPDGTLVHRLTNGLAGPRAFLLRGRRLYVLNNGDAMEQGASAQLPPSIAIYDLFNDRPSRVVSLHLKRVEDFALTSTGGFAVATSGDNAVVKIDRNGHELARASFDGADEIATDAVGHFYVRSHERSVTHQFDSSLRDLGVFPNIPATDAAGHRYVSDGRAIRMLDANSRTVAAFSGQDAYHVQVSADQKVLARVSNGILIIDPHHPENTRTLRMNVENFSPGAVRLRPTNATTPGPELAEAQYPGAAAIGAAVPAATKGIIYRQNDLTTATLLARYAFLGPLLRVDEPAAHKIVLADCNSLTAAVLNTAHKTFYVAAADRAVSPPQPTESGAFRPPSNASLGSLRVQTTAAPGAFTRRVELAFGGERMATFLEVEYLASAQPHSPCESRVFDGRELPGPLLPQEFDNVHGLAFTAQTYGLPIARTGPDRPEEDRLVGRYKLTTDLPSHGEGVNTVGATQTIERVLTTEDIGLFSVPPNYRRLHGSAPSTHSLTL